MAKSNILGNLSNAAFVVAAFGMSAAFIYAVGKSLYDHNTQVNAQNEFRANLITSAKRSEAHRFLVSNWLECSALNSTQASCFAAIRTSAASRGEAFVHQVDIAARELKLI